MTSWIDGVGPEDADGALAELYEKARDRVSGEVDNILRVHSLHPRGLAAHWNLYTAVMAPTRSLPKAEREMIALVVSTLNDCHY